MPELPEVETTRRGIIPHIEGQIVHGTAVRQPELRWPVPTLEHLTGQTLRTVMRRAKYLLLHFDHGTLILHLGMSGSLRILPPDTPPQAHDHFDLVFGGLCLRLRDPRRFGAVLWTDQPPERHPLLRRLGPEPLSDTFDTNHLYTTARHRHIPIKALVMDGHVVAGVGNIYATEALFLSGIAPARRCNRIARPRIAMLVKHIKQVLTKAITQGGTTLRDFQREDGRPGYFAQSLCIYGHEGLPCPACGTTLRARSIAQRNSTWCPHCQH